MNLKSIAQGLLCVGLLMGTLYAEDEQRVPARARQLSVVEHLSIQEQRAERHEKEEAQPVQDEETDEERVSNAASFVTSHPGAAHFATKVSYLGDFVDLNDGSVWYVRDCDRIRTLDWYNTDTIILTPNHAWFSRFDYCLRNLTTGAQVEVNMYQPPYYNGVYTLWITTIDLYNDKMCLSDGSIWNIAGYDHSMLKKWMPNDTVIIGINDGILSSVYPNTLVNVTTDPVSYLSCKCLYY